MATTKQNGVQRSDVAVAMIPLPAQGHLNQLLHFSRRITAHNIPVYYIGADTHIRQAKLRAYGLDNSIPIKFHEFPSIPFHNPPPDPNAPTRFPAQIIPSLNASTQFRKPVFEFVNGLSGIYRRVVVIYDSLMAYVVQDLDSVQNAECYKFVSISAISVCSWERDLPDLSNGTEVLKELPSMDGYYPPEFAEFLHLQRGSKMVCSGEIYNSCQEIEGLFLDLLEKRKINGGAKIWALGPFNHVSLPEIIKSRDGHECLEWLDKQETNSVIFVSFGTTSSFPDEQIKEVAFGLEKSGHKFIWVLRDADKGNIFTGEVKRNQLPENFEKRVEERSIIIRDWAPQLEILGHQSTGGFMSHCGWNSCLESICMGVPIATWPLHSDQPGNSILITNVLKIGVEVKPWSHSNGLVESDVVKKAVRQLMGSEEGDKMRKRAANLGEIVKHSIMEGGTTHMEMNSFITRITR